MSTPPSDGSSRPFVFLHVGDQHLTVRDAPHHRDLVARGGVYSRMHASWASQQRTDA